jgi:hypothetical protein
MKAIPDFNIEDKKKFEATRKVLQSQPIVKIAEIGTEYTRYDDPQAPHPPENVGVAFYTECFWCKTRYVYWPNYKSLPPDWIGEIRYIPINKNWYRVEED